MLFPVESDSAIDWDKSGPMYLVALRKIVSVLTNGCRA
jgi:hypothetical protein